MYNGLDPTSFSNWWKWEGPSLITKNTMLETLRPHGQKQCGGENVIRRGMGDIVWKTCWIQFNLSWWGEVCHIQKCATETNENNSPVHFLKSLVYILLLIYILLLKYVSNSSSEKNPVQMQLFGAAVFSAVWHFPLLFEWLVCIIHFLCSLWIL